MVIGSVVIPCPSCQGRVRISIDAIELIADGPLRVEVRPRWSHECPPRGGGATLPVAA